MMKKIRGLWLTAQFIKWDFISLLIGLFWFAVGLGFGLVCIEVLRGQ